MTAPGIKAPGGAPAPPAPPADVPSIPAGRPHDRRFELLLSRVLILGTIASGAVIALGAAAVIATSGRTTADFSRFAAATGDAHSIAAVVRGILELDARAMLVAGVLLVIATPVVRVGFSLVSFAIEKDRLYVMMTAIVLAVLLYSMAFSR